MATSVEDTKDFSEEELRKLLKPSPSEDDVVDLLKKSYASDNQTVKIVKQLESYDDVNYLVHIDDCPYLFKIHNGVESKDFTKVLEEAGGDYYAPGKMNSIFHFQNALMELLSDHSIPTPVPQYPKARENGDKTPPLTVHSLPVVSRVHSPCRLVVRLLSWIPGRPMSSIRFLPLEALANAGRCLGKVNKTLDLLTDDAFSSKRDKTLAKYDSSLLNPARRFHQWDGKNTVELRSFTHCIANEKRRRLVESVIDTFEKDILKSDVASEFRRGVNHADFNDANILVDQDLHIVGVIDFGDSVESWRVLDVSVAMAYGTLSSYGKSNRMVSAAAGVLRGFNSVYPLTNLERKHLVLLIACRLACSATLGAYSYQQNPENEYLLFHAEPCWKALDLLWPEDPQRRQSLTSAINRVFDQACRYTDTGDDLIACDDLAFPDPTVADLLHSIRVSSSFKDDTKPSREVAKPPKKKQKQTDGRPVITFVTGNEKKLEEVKRILGVDDADELPYVLRNEKVDLPELQGDTMSIAKEKCVAAAEKVGGAVITEDTSLCFNALNDLPGPYIKWFLESCGHEGLNKMIGAFDDKTGYAQTVVAFSPGPGKDPALFDGRTKGKIVPARGKLDFGWDPVFQPDEAGGKTYAEMTKDEKDSISHRYRAFTQLRGYLKDKKEAILNS